jgi:hypothetical protein
MSFPVSGSAAVMPVTGVAVSRVHVGGKLAKLLQVSGEPGSGIGRHLLELKSHASREVVSLFSSPGHPGSGLANAKIPRESESQQTNALFLRQLFTVKKRAAQAHVSKIALKRR